MNCFKGCVSPLGLLNDKDNVITFILDQNIVLDGNLLVHPLQNDLTIEINAQTLFDFIDKQYTVIDFSNIKVEDENNDKDGKNVKDGKEKEYKEKKEKDNKKNKKEKDIKKEEKQNINIEEENELIGITIKREDNFSEWYQQIIKKAELLDF